MLREVGSVVATRKGDDDTKTLDQLHFETGVWWLLHSMCRAFG